MNRIRRWLVQNYSEHLLWTQFYFSGKFFHIISLTHNIVISKNYLLTKYGDTNQFILLLHAWLLSLKRWIFLWLSRNNILKLLDILVRFYSCNFIIFRLKLKQGLRSKLENFLEVSIFDAYWWCEGRAQELLRTKNCCYFRNRRTYMRSANLFGFIVWGVWCFGISWWYIFIERIR